MISKQTLDYLISNGEYCIIFLEGLAKSASDHRECNAINNHALAVYGLMNSLRLAVSDCVDLSARLALCTGKLKEVESGDLERLVSERVEEIKKSLIDYIEEF